MKPLLQLFEFSYPGGYLFIDKGGEICHRLANLLPGLAPVSIETTEIKLQSGFDGIDLWLGVRSAAIQTTRPGKTSFPKMAAQFAEIVCSALQLTSIESFRFRQVVGRSCASKADAAALMRPLIPKQSQETLEGLADAPNWRAVQAEYERNNLAFLDRIAVIDLVPQDDDRPLTSTSSNSLPHLTVHLDIRGLAPLPVSELDVAALVQNVGQQHLENILSKLVIYPSQI